MIRIPTHKDGHAVADCIDPRERRVLEFVMPILYPERPGRVTMTMGNTIFGALSEVREVSWGQVIQEVVDKLVSNLENEKPSSICSYLFHLYHRFECLKEEEIVKIEAAKYCLEYGVSLEAEAELEVVEIDSERESLSSIEQRKILGTSPGSRKKFTYRSPEGKSPVRNPNWKTIAMASFNFKDSPF